MRTTWLSFLALSLLPFSCTQQAENLNNSSHLNGSWRGVIGIQGKELPFTFMLSGPEQNLQMEIYNAGEVLEVNDLFWRGDTLIIPMHIFDTEIRAVVESGSMKGSWTKNYVEDYILPFTATKADYRFPSPEVSAQANISGKWAVQFYKEEQNDPTQAIGVFEQTGSIITGTFLTPTGDYRYLEGSMYKQDFLLSAFDGEHAYLFEGKVKESGEIEGSFLSGKSGNERRVARKDDQANLPNPDSLTFLKEGYDKLAFEFPDLEGTMVSLEDKRFENKVVIVQLFGSWCPNCMDETRFLADWYRKNKNREVAIIGLAYEKKDDFEYASKRVKKMADRLEVDYPFLIAGTADKAAAAETLPMLNHVLSFPTTIFIDKEGTVRKIHTGFSGPGTGEYYHRFVEEFELFTDKLLAE